MLRPLFLLILGIVVAVSLRAENAPETPSFLQIPPFYEQVKDRLTPREEVMAGIERFRDSAKPGINLLSERVEFIGEDDVRYAAYHGIYYVKDKAGIPEVAKDVFSFRKSGEEIFLVEGKTIHPDGRETRVASNAVFIQSPQTEAQANLYTDRDELVVIYPDVAVGCVLEYVVIAREHTPIVPGQYSRTYYFQRGWPSYRQRYVVDLPREMAARARTTRTGAGVPERSESIAGERVIWTYELGPRDGLPFEVNREPLEDTGPLERISTFQSWDEIGDWFRGLINERNTLDDELRAAIDAWTADAETREEIIAAVFDRVANDVRYTGLEFGLAGYQPYDCNIVWKNRYGDCKDKANLLAAALAYKGIPAYIALIDTTGLGKFDPASPNPFYFNHAIAAVEQQDGSYLFLDPTIENLRVGDLPTGDVNRLAAVIREDRVELARTPNTPLGAARYRLDLALDASLTLSGWLDFSGERYYRSWFHDYYEDLSPEALREDLRGQVQSMFPGSATHDAAFDADPENGEPMARAYFTHPHEAHGEDGSYALKAPKLDWFIDNTGDSSERATDFQIRSAEQEMVMNVELPDGMRPVSLPRDFDVSTPSYQFQAQWRQREGRLSAEVRVTRRADRIAPADFAAYREASRSLERWWTNPVFISVGQSAANQVAAKPAFPRLSSARGQLDLATELYGAAEDAAPFIDAAKKVLEWFPDDRAVGFEAKMEMIRHDLERLDPRVAAQRIQALLSEYKSDIGVLYYAWGEFLLAQSLEAAGQKEKALDLFLGHLGRDDLIPFRVGWSGYNAARLLEESDPKRVAETVWLALEDESEATSSLIHQLVSRRLKDLDKKRLRSDLAELRRRFPTSFEASLRSATESMEAGYELASPKSVALWREAIEAQARDFPGLADLRPSLVRLESQAGLARALPKFAKELAATLRDDPPPWLLGAFAAKLSADELAIRIEKTETSEDWKSHTSYCLYLVANHPADLERASEALSWIGWTLGREIEPSAGLDAFLDARLESLPPANDELCDARINWATRLLQEDKTRRASEVLRGLLEYDGLSRAYRGIAHVRLAQVLEQDGQPEQALKEYFAGAAYHFDNGRIYFGVLRAYFLALSLGDLEAARRSIAILGEADKENLGSETYSQQAAKVLELQSASDFAEQHWTVAREARAELQRLRPELGHFEGSPPPIIYDYAALLGEIASSRSDRNAFFEAYSPLLRSAIAIPSDVELAADQLTSSGLEDDATRGVARALLPLVDLGIESGSYANRSGLKKQKQRLLTHFGEHRAAADYAKSVLDDARSTEIEKDFAANFRAALVLLNRIELPDALPDLLARIESSDMAAIRGSAVTCASSLLAKESRQREALALIERELKNAHVQADGSSKTALETMQRELQKGDAAVEAFSSVVRTWLEGARIGWWDHVEPLSKEQLYDNGALRPYEEAVDFQSLVTRVKYELLVAADSDETLEHRHNALYSGLSRWTDIEPDPQRAQTLLAQLYQDERLGEYARNRIKSFAFYEACESGNSGAAKSVFGDGAFLLDRFRSDRAHYLRYLEQPKETPEQFAAAVEFLLEDPLSSFDLSFLSADFAAAALRFEDGIAAERVLATIAQAKIFAGESASAQQAQIECLQAWRRSRALRPVAALLRDLCRDSFSFPARSGLPYLPMQLSFEEFESSIMWHLETGYASGYLFSMMQEVLNYARNVKKTLTPERIDAVFAAFDAAGKAAYASDFAAAIQNAVDLDEEDQAQRYFKSLEMYLSRHDSIDMANLYNYYRFSHEARYGSAESLARLDFLSPKGALGQQDAYRLLQLFHAGDLDGARARFEALDPEVLTSPIFQFEMHAIAVSLGDSVMESLIASRIRENMQAGVLYAISDNGAHPFAILSYALRFPEDAKSLSWYAEYMSETSRNPFIGGLARMLKGLFDEDWETVVLEARATDEVAPSYWDIQLPLALALHRLGRAEEASAAIEIYLRYRPSHALAGLARDLKIDIEEARAVAARF